MEIQPKTLTDFEANMRVRQGLAGIVVVPLRHRSELEGFIKGAKRRIGPIL